MDKAGTNILIVSSNVATCLYVQILAHQDGFHAVYFTRPEEAMSAFQNEPDRWSAVFVDMLSPELEKFGLVSKLQQIRPGIRLVILTTHVTEQIRQVFKQEFRCDLCHDCSMMKNRHCYFLHKPFYCGFDRVIHQALAGLAEPSRV